MGQLFKACKACGQLPNQQRTQLMLDWLDESKLKDGAEVNMQANVADAADSYATVSRSGQNAVHLTDRVGNASLPSQHSTDELVAAVRPPGCCRRSLSWRRRCRSCSRRMLSSPPQHRCVLDLTH